MRVLGLAAVLLVACGTSEEPGDKPLDPPPPEGGQQLATDSWTVQPGEEKYICFQFYSPDEAVAITKVEQLSATGIHHFALYQAFGRNEPDEPHECATLIKQTWNPIYVSGTGSHALELPAGTGFIIQPRTQYIIQLHLQNTGDEAMTVRGGVNLTYEHDTSALTPAGIFALGNFNVSIPAQSTGTQVPVAACAPNKEMNVFAVFPHMHKLGSKIELTRTVEGGAPAPFYEVDPWDFGNAPVAPLVQAIAPTDTFDLTCSYTNPYDHDVGFGESSDDEMCFFVLFYYPYDHIDGCIIN